MASAAKDRDSAALKSLVGDDLIVRQIADLLAVWEASGESHADFSRRLLCFFRSGCAEVNGEEAPKPKDKKPAK